MTELIDLNNTQAVWVQMQMTALLSCQGCHKTARVLDDGGGVAKAERFIARHKRCV